jgi:hypothetical protein
MDAAEPDQVPTFITLNGHPSAGFQSEKCPVCQEIITSVKQYQRHVGRHQEDLALFALPSRAEDEEVEPDSEDKEWLSSEDSDDVYDGNRISTETDPEPGPEKNEEEEKELERINPEEALAIARAEQDARDRLEAERRAEGERKKREVEVATTAEAAALAKLEEVIRPEADAKAADGTETVSGYSSVAPSRSPSPSDPKHGSTTNLQAAGADQGDGNTPKTCTNCFTQVTPLWRRGPEGQPLCNACALFLQLHGVARPLSLKTDVIKKRNRGSGASLLAEAPMEAAVEEAEWRKTLEAEAKLKAEIGARIKLETERKDAEEAKKTEEAWKTKALEDAKAKAEEAAKKEPDKAPIQFRDAVGRRFAVPFHVCQTWQVRSPYLIIHLYNLIDFRVWKRLSSKHFFMLTLLVLISYKAITI